MCFIKRMSQNEVVTCAYRNDPGTKREVYIFILGSKYPNMRQIDVSGMVQLGETVI